MKGLRFLTLTLAVMALVLLGFLLLSQSLVAAPPIEDRAIASGLLEPEAVWPKSSWYSGWVSVTQGTCQVLAHNLGGDAEDYGVEMWFLDTDDTFDLQRGINRENWGGLEVGGFWRGAHWENLESDTIEVCREAQDWTSDRVSVRVWQVPGETGYDSGWRDIDPGPANALTLDHDLGVPALDLAVSLWFSGTEKGIHQYAYGGLEDSTDGNKIHGAWWDSLTDTTVRVTRGHQDEYVEQVRVIVAETEAPDYDSYAANGGWTDVSNLVPATFTHGLDWPANLLVVRAECNSPGIGIHQQAAGGIHYGFGLGWYGAFVRNLTRNHVLVERDLQDGICSQVRVRVWKRGAMVYLPFVVRE